MFKKVPPSSDTASKVLEFIGKAMVRPFAPVVAEVDRLRAAQVIQMPVRRHGSVSERPSVHLTHKVTDCIDSLFPHLRGALRQDMISAVSQKISEDPRLGTPVPISGSKSGTS